MLLACDTSPPQVVGDAEEPVSSAREATATTADHAPSAAPGPQDETGPPLHAASPNAPSSSRAAHPGDIASPKGAPSNDAPPSDVPRVYAKSRHVWIRSMPSSEVQWIGYLWWGGSVAIRSEERVPGAGCSTEWVPVEPRGWVCADGERATTDVSDPVLRKLYALRPRIESPWPHRYAAVHAPLRVYDQLPDESTMAMLERGFRSHMDNVKKARLTGSVEHFPDLLGVVDPSLSHQEPPSLPSLPAGLSEGRTRIAARSALAYVAEGDYADRDFLLTADLNWVPKDRVELVPRSEFQGVELGGAVKLPLAFFRGRARPGYVRNADGAFEEVKDAFARHSYVALSADFVQDGNARYYKLEDKELWVNTRQAVVPIPRKETPWGAPVGQPDTTGRARTGRATWLEASILGGWLVAFEGTTPKYVTLISAGRGGTPHGDRDPLETASTPTGRFAIGGKFKTATMESSSTPIVHTDVPWTQNFSGPHAIHSAYWHDDFGELKSAGCVNVSPRDGKWLFEFTEPDVPDGWHGVRYVSRYGGGSTLLVIHE